MLQTILVPLDGSPFAEQALAPAVRLARQSDAALLLLFAASEEVLPAGPEYPLLVSEREAGTYLRLLQGRLRRAGVTAHVEVSGNGAAQTIIATAAIHEIDVIAMVTHGRNGPRQTLAGSVTQQVIADAQTPLLLVRSGSGAPMIPEGTGFRRLLVPLDGSRDAERSLRFLEEAALIYKASLTLLRVVPHSLPRSMPGLQGYDAAVGHDQAEIETKHGQMEAYRYLDAAVRGTIPGASCRTRVAVGYPAKVILDTAVADESDVIVLSCPASEAAWPRQGSVPWHVLHHTQVPVLLLRPAPASLDAARKVPAKTAAVAGSGNGRVAVLAGRGNDD